MKFTYHLYKFQDTYHLTVEFGQEEYHFKSKNKDELSYLLSCLCKLNAYAIKVFYEDIPDE